jgi:hypothetical protein
MAFDFRQKFLSLSEFISACENSALEGIKGRLTSVRAALDKFWTRNHSTNSLLTGE